MDWRVLFSKLDNDFQRNMIRNRSLLHSWFLVRYDLSEFIKEEHWRPETVSNDFLASARRKLIPNNISLNSFATAFKCLFRKNRNLLFPHERTSDLNGVDQYLFLNIPEHYLECAVNFSKKRLEGALFFTLMSFFKFLTYPFLLIPVFFHAYLILVGYECAKLYFSKGFFIKVFLKLIRAKSDYLFYLFYLKIFRVSSIHFADRSNKFPLLLAARKLNIPVHEYQHGLPVTGKWNYDFGIFNKYFFENLLIYTYYDVPAYLEELRSLGMRPVVCQGRVSRIFANRKTNPRITQDNPMLSILIVTQPELPVSLAVLKLVHTLTASGALVLIKPHPADFFSYGEHFGSETACVHILAKNSEAFYENLSMVDAVVGFHSTAVVEAFSAGVPSFLFRTDKLLSCRLQEIFLIPEVDDFDVCKKILG